MDLTLHTAQKLCWSRKALPELLQQMETNNSLECHDMGCVIFIIYGNIVINVLIMCKSARTHCLMEAI